MKFLSLLSIVITFALLESCTSGSRQPADDPKIIAYYYPRGDDFDPDTLRLDKITHIIFSFTEVIDNEMKFKNESQGLLLKKLSDQKARYPGLNVMVACGGWGGSGGFSDMAKTSESRTVFVESVVNFIRHYNLDGLDIDWEYPGLPGIGNPNIPQDKENFTLLMQEIRQALDKIGRDQILTFAAAGWQKYFDQVELEKVMQHVDYINIMSYDLAGGGDKFTSHHTNLGLVKMEDIEGTPAAEIIRQGSDSTRPWSAQEIIDFCISKGVDPAQIVIGAAFYGKGWIGVPPENNGLYQLNRGPWKGWGQYSSLRQSYEERNGFVRYWDSIAMAPFLYNDADSIFISYEDTVSVRLKTEYVLEKGLGGIMFWELGSDARNKGLLDAINSVTKR